MIAHLTLTSVKDRFGLNINTIIFITIIAILITTMLLKGNNIVVFVNILIPFSVGIMQPWK